MRANKCIFRRIAPQKFGHVEFQQVLCGPWQADCKRLQKYKVKNSQDTDGQREDWPCGTASLTKEAASKVARLGLRKPGSGMEEGATTRC